MARSPLFDRPAALEAFRQALDEGAGNGVVLIAGDDHPAARLDQGVNGNIQPVGGIEGKDHLLRLRHMEQRGRLLPAGKGGIRRVHGRPVASPAGAGQMVDGPGRCPGHAGRLLQSGGCAVQINHSATS